MNLVDKAFLLKKTSLFNSLDLDLLLSIADKLEVESYKKGSKIFKLNEEAREIYIIAEGAISITKGDQKLAKLGPAEYFGTEAVLSEKPRAYEATCESAVSLLILSQTHFYAILAECPQLALSLLESYAAHLDFKKSK